MPLTTSPSQYADPTQLVQLALTPAAAARFGADQQTNCLLAASAIADSFLAGQFTLPLLTWDLSLTLAVCNIAAKLLFDQFGYNPSAPIDKLVERRYEEAIDWLSAVRDKKIQPQWTDSSVTGTDATGNFIISDRPVGFTERGRCHEHVFGDSWWGWEWD